MIYYKYREKYSNCIMDFLEFKSNCFVNKDANPISLFFCTKFNKAFLDYANLTYNCFSTLLNNVLYPV